MARPGNRALSPLYLTPSASSSTSNLLLLTQPSSPLSPSLDPDAHLPLSHSQPLSSHSLSHSHSHSHPYSPSSPLPLSPSPPPSPPPQHARSDPPKIHTTAPWQLSNPTHIIALVATIKFCITFLGMLIMIPTYRLLQDVFCHARLDDDSPGLIDEKRCLEVDAVQADLAYFLAFVGLLHAVCILLSAFPYGVLADSIGRKPTVLISYSAMYLHTSLIYFGLWFLQPAVRRNPWVLAPVSLLTLLGGGFHAVFSTLYAVAADVSTDATRADNFLRLTFGTTLGGTAGPVICGILMQRYGPWMPFTCVVVASPIVHLLLAFLPETLPAKNKARRHSRHSRLRSLSNPQWPRLRRTDMHRRAAHALAELLSSVRLLRSPDVLLTLATFLIQPILFSAYTTTLSLYVTRSFGWSLAQVSMLLSPLSVLSLLVIAGLPFLKTMSFFAASSDFMRDLRLARASLLALACGSTIQFLAPNFIVFLLGLVVNTLGAAHSPLCRAVVTAHIPKAHTSRLYALISMAEIIGSCFGGPVLAWWFDIGMRSGGAWEGLPWGYIAVWCVGVWVCLLFVKKPREDEEGGEVGGGGDSTSGGGERYRDDDDDDDEDDGDSDMGVEMGDTDHSKPSEPLVPLHQL